MAMPQTKHIVFKDIILGLFHTLVGLLLLVGVIAIVIELYSIFAPAVSLFFTLVGGSSFGF